MIVRRWSSLQILQARPGVLVVGDGWVEGLGVRFRVIDYDRDREIWTGVLDDNLGRS